MLSQLNRLIPLAWKHQVIERLGAARFDLPHARRALIFLAADYGNIGDLAITAAQQHFIAQYCPGCTVVAVPISVTRQAMQSIVRQIRPDDLVTIIGGGNMGRLYPDIEALRRLVIRRFPRNRIICFPQTLDWTDDTDGTMKLAQLVAAYARHRRLTIYARERVSHEKLTALFAAHPHVSIGLAPDIVLTLKPVVLGVAAAGSRSGVLMCLRDDKERLLSPYAQAMLWTLAAATGEKVTKTDTHTGGSHLAASAAADALAGKLREFGSASMVITDRLHGMILARITGTPCLALPSSNHKVGQTWRDWLQRDAMVQMLDPADVAGAGAVMARLLNQTPDAGAAYCSDGHDQLATMLAGL